MNKMNGLEKTRVTDAVFVNPSPGGRGLNEATVEPPLGLAYMASVLEQNGFECSIIDANVLHLDTAQVMQIMPHDAKLVGFYINSFNYNSVLELTTHCRELLPEALLLLGGPLANVLPKELLSEIPCHALIRGEGEYSVLRIMENVRNGNQPFDEEVSGAVYHDTESKEVVMNPIIRIKDLDQLPFPAYHLLPHLNVYKSRVRKQPKAAIISSRGCSYGCSFCSKDVFQRKTTFRSAANVLAEIDHLVKNYGIRQIDILDDNFAMKRSRVEEILDGIAGRGYGLALNFQSGIRTEELDEALLKKMKNAGVYKLAFGIESADSNVLKLCSKRLDLNKAESVIKLAKEQGFLVYGFFIIGLPGETEEAFYRTLEFARRLDFDIANFCMAVPFIGTDLYRMVEKEGRFLIDTTRNIDTGFYGGDVFFEYGDAKKADILRHYNTAYREFYSLSKKIKMVTKIRTWAELCWHFNATKFVLKSFVRARLNK